MSCPPCPYLLWASTFICLVLPSQCVSVPYWRPVFSSLLIASDRRLRDRSSLSRVCPRRLLSSVLRKEQGLTLHHGSLPQVQTWHTLSSQSFLSGRGIFLPCQPGEEVFFCCCFFFEGAAEALGTALSDHAGGTISAPAWHTLTYLCSLLQLCQPPWTVCIMPCTCVDTFEFVVLSLACSTMV